MFGLIIVHYRLTWPKTAAGPRSTGDDLRFASPRTESQLLASITVNVADAMRETDNAHDSEVDLHDTLSRAPTAKVVHIYALGDP